MTVAGDLGSGPMVKMGDKPLKRKLPYKKFNDYIKSLMIKDVN